MATEHHFHGVLDWVGAWQGTTKDYESYSRDFQFFGEGKPVIHGSAAGPYRGNDAFSNPEELLLVAVSSCHMLSYLAECARSGIHVLRYLDSCTARMAFKDGRMRIVEATLRPKIEFGPDTDLETAASLHERAHEVCFIANSVNFPILVEVA